MSTSDHPAPDWLPSALDSASPPSAPPTEQGNWWHSGELSAVPASPVPPPAVEAGSSWWVGATPPVADAPPPEPELEFAGAAVTDALPLPPLQSLSVPSPVDFRPALPEPLPLTAPVPLTAPPVRAATSSVPPAALAAVGALFGLIVLVGGIGAWVFLTRPASQANDAVAANVDTTADRPNSVTVYDGDSVHSARTNRKPLGASHGELTMPLDVERKPDPVAAQPPPKKEEPTPVVRNDPPPVKEPVPADPPKQEEAKADPVRLEPRVEAVPPPPEKPPQPGELVIKQRRNFSAEELTHTVARAPEVSLDVSLQRNETVKMWQGGLLAAKQGRPFDGTPILIKQRTDLAGLPVRMGDACTLSPSAADHLQGGSVTLRQHLTMAALGRVGIVGIGVPAGDPRPDPKLLHTALTTDGERHNKWLKPEAIPALLQLLMAENEAVRLVMVDQIALIPGPQASVALAQRAVFDLNPEVRKAALEALRKRPKEEYSQVLLDGLLYPWSVPADHAAEALVALDMRDTVPALVGLLDAPDPNQPYEKPGVGPMVREVVRINHLRNCMLCHPPSFSENDKVRGRVPPSTQPLQPFSSGYGGNQNDIFVRADVTYLRQDFSVPLPVANPGLWPEVQRFDFMVRERPARASEIPAKAAPGEVRPPSENQKALFFALRQLTGQDPGPSAEDWKRLFLRTSAPTKLPDGLKGGGGVAADVRGNVFAADKAGSTLLRLRSGEVVTLKKDAVCNSLAFDARGRLIACQAGQVVAVDTESGDITVLADSTRTPNLRSPAYVTADGQGGVYLSVPEGADARTPGAIYYLSAQGTLTHLPNALKKPRGLAVSPDGKALYVACADSLDVHVFTMESVGNPANARLLGKLDAVKGESVVGGAGVAVDAQGNVFVAHPGHKAVQVFSAAGARLGLVTLPEAPLHVALGGEGRKQLLVSTADSVFTAELTFGPGVAARER